MDQSRPTRTPLLPGGTLLLLAALLLPAFAAAADAPAVARTVRIGIVPFYAADKMWQLYRPLVDHLNAKTPYHWEMVLGDRHDELTAKVLSGEIDVGFLGPVPYGKALRAGPVKPLLVALGTDGEPHYHAVIITADPAVHSLFDLQGRRFAIYEKSTAAHYVPLAMLARARVPVSSLVLAPFASQDKVAAAVLSNQAAGGGVKESLSAKLRQEGLRVLQTSDPLPQLVFCAGPALDPGVEKAFTAALLALSPRTRPADREAVKGWDPEVANGFARPASGYDDEVRRFLDSVEPFLGGR